VLRFNRKTASPDLGIILISGDEIHLTAQCIDLRSSTIPSRQIDGDAKKMKAFSNRQDEIVMGLSVQTR